MPIRTVKTVLVGLLLAGSISLGSPRLLADETRVYDSLRPAAHQASYMAPVENAGVRSLAPISAAMEEAPFQEYCDYDEYGGCDDCGYGDCEYGDCGVCEGYGTNGVWMRIDYLQWWTKGSRLPPLVATGTVADPRATILFGDSTVFRGARSNARFRLGYWLDACQTFSVEAEYFDLGSKSAQFSEPCATGRILSRPFFDVVNQQESAQIITFPEVAAGCIGVTAKDYFSSAGSWFRYNLFWVEPCYDECDAYGDEYACQIDCASPRNSSIFRLDVVAGFRHYRYSDSLSIREGVISLNPSGPMAIGTRFDINDRFAATNKFNGAELGLIAQVNRGRWSLELAAKMALGNNRRTVLIDGTTTIASPGLDPDNYAGGVLALPTNMGHYVSNNFVVIPEFGIDVGYQVNDRTRVYVGYNVLAWANIVRSGDQVDLGINPTQLPPGTLVGEPRPAFEFKESSFWAQGLNLGLEVNF